MVVNAGDLPPSPQPYNNVAGLPAKGGMLLRAISKVRLPQPLFNGGGGPPRWTERIAIVGAANGVRGMASVTPMISPTNRRADARKVSVAEATRMISLKPKETLGPHRRSSQRLEGDSTETRLWRTK